MTPEEQRDETFKILLPELRTAYLEESRRHPELINKAQTLLLVNSLLVATAGIFADSLLRPNMFLHIMMGSSLMSIGTFSWLLRPRTFSSMNFDKILPEDRDEAKKSIDRGPREIREKLTFNYRNAKSDHNRDMEAIHKEFQHAAAFTYGAVLSGLAALVCACCRG